MVDPQSLQVDHHLCYHFKIRNHKSKITEEIKTLTDRKAFGIYAFITLLSVLVISFSHYRDHCLSMSVLSEGFRFISDFCIMCSIPQKPNKVQGLQISHDCKSSVHCICCIF